MGTNFSMKISSTSTLLAIVQCSTLLKGTAKCVALSLPALQLWVAVEAMSMHPPERVCTILPALPTTSHMLQSRRLYTCQREKFTHALHALHLTVDRTLHGHILCKIQQLALWFLPSQLPLINLCFTNCYNVHRVYNSLLQPAPYFSRA